MERTFIMCKIISCNNQKGGSGKTATSINIAKGLSDDGYRVLLVDLDLQANTSSKFLEDYESMNGIVEVIRDGLDLKDVIYRTDYPGLDVIPTKLEWIDVMEEMASQDHIEQYEGKENSSIKIIRKLLDPIRNEYDFIILDNNPSYLTILKNCIYAADYIIVPVNIDKNAIKGVDYMIRFITKVIDGSDEDIACRPRILITKRTRTKIAEEVVEGDRDMFWAYTFDTTVANQNAPAEKQTFIEDYFMINNTKTKVGRDYRDLVNEIRREMN